MNMGQVNVASVIQQKEVQICKTPRKCMGAWNSEIMEMRLRYQSSWFYHHFTSTV